MADSLRGRDLLSVAQLSRDGIVEVLEVAEAFAEVSRRAVPKVPTLRGRQVTSLFFEESTRTRLSFETAARRLSADVASLAVAASSVTPEIVSSARTVMTVMVFIGLTSRPNVAENVKAWRFSGRSRETMVTAP